MKWKKMLYRYSKNLKKRYEYSKIFILMLNLGILINTLNFGINTQV